MGAKKRTRGILIVDADQAFLASIKADPKNARVQSFTAASLKEAQLIIANKEISFIAIFLNPILTGSIEMQLIKHAHSYRPATPIYLVHDKVLPIEEKDFNSLGIQKALKKPVTYTDLIQVADPPRFDEADAEAFATPEAVGEELAAGDSEFKAIRASDFISGSKSFFDVFIQLGSGKYIKIVKANDAFEKERVVNYLKKGVTHFYIRSAAQEAYLNYCDEVAKLIMKSEKVSPQIKVAQVMNFGEEALSFLKTNGISETNLQYASHYVQHVHTMVSRLGANKSAAIAQFLKDIAAYEHGSSTALVAHLLVKPLGFSDPETLDSLGFACLFHDLGLQEMPENIRSEDVSKMSEEELKLFHTHPELGAQRLRGVPGISEAVVQAVYQHHERRTRRGFPHQLGAGSINGIAEIVGLCDEFVNLMRWLKTGSTVNPLVELERKIFDGFSAGVVDAFRSGVLGRK